MGKADTDATNDEQRLLCRGDTASAAGDSSKQIERRKDLGVSCHVDV
jgi:hypothetical protein